MVSPAEMTSHQEREPMRDTKATSSNPPSVVGNSLVKQYYHLLVKNPANLFRFYTDDSRMTHGLPGAEGETVFSQMEIHEKIMGLGFSESTTQVLSVDSQYSHEGGVLVLVNGILYGTDGRPRPFVQTFFLAPQENGYFVLNDIIRYLPSFEAIARDSIVSQQTAARRTPPAAEPVAPAPVADATAAPVSTTQPQQPPQQLLSPRKQPSAQEAASPPPAQATEGLYNGHHGKEQPMGGFASPSSGDALAATSSPAASAGQRSPFARETADASNQHKEGTAAAAPGAVGRSAHAAPAGWGADAGPWGSAGSGSGEEGEGGDRPKLSYASILRMREAAQASARSAAQAAAAAQRQQAAPAHAEDAGSTGGGGGGSARDSGASEDPDSGAHEDEVDGKAVFVKNLPPTVTTEQLHAEFATFGPLKGVQLGPLKSQKQGAIFAFVEFADHASVAAALEATIHIGDRHIVVEEKRASPSRSNRGARAGPGRSRGGATGDRGDMGPPRGGFSSRGGVGRGGSGRGGGGERRPVTDARDGPRPPRRGGMGGMPPGPASKDREGGGRGGPRGGTPPPQGG
eukprot:jgi/Mesvir1/885/Mv17451-RA.1